MPSPYVRINANLTDCVITPKDGNYMRMEDVAKAALATSKLSLLRQLASNAAITNPRINPAMATPPAISVLTALPSDLTNDYNAYQTSVFSYTGGSTKYSSTTERRGVCVQSVADNDQYTYYRIKVKADCNKIAFWVVDTGTENNYRVIVDGKYASFTFTTNTVTNGSAFIYITVDFTNAGGRAVRDITLEGVTCFIAAFVGGTETLNRIADEGLSIFLFGDSYSQCYGTFFPTPTSVTDGMFDAFNYIMADRLGATDLLNNSVAGCGYLAPGGAAGSALTAPQRIGDLQSLASSTDIVMIALGHNDVVYLAADTQAAALAFFKAIRAVVPAAPIIVFGVFAATLNATVPCIETEAAIQAAVVQFNDPNCYFIPCNSDPAGAWFTGTGYEGHPTGSGNCDVYIYSDQIHPIAAGHQFLAGQCVNAVRNLLSTLNA
jgi:lysophospholipase L1-like esterase